MKRLIPIFLAGVIVLVGTGTVRAQSWTGTDVGSVGKTGSDNFNATTNTYTLQGSGADIWGTADAFHFVYQTISGDGELVARVASVQNTNTWAKAGVMVRQSLSPGSIQAMTVVTPGSGVALQYRTTQAGSSTNVQTTGLVAPYWVKIVKDQDIVTSYVSPDGVNWTLIQYLQLNFTGPVEIGLVTCSHNNSALCTATFDNITLTTQPNFSGPSPWLDQDIGAVGVTGAVHFENNLWNIYASGTDIWSNADAFHFAYQPLSGDGSIVARIDSVTNTNSWTKAGVMIRQDLTPGSPQALVAVTPGNGVAFQWRTVAGGSSSTQAGAKVMAPYWVRLTRAGNLFYAYQSPDGVSWTPLGVQSISMATNVYIGLAESSHNNGALALGEFSHVQNVPPSLMAESVTDTTIDLVWPTLADPTLVDQYEVDRNGVEVATSSITSYEDIQLTPSTSYTYVIKALSSTNQVLAVSAPLIVTTNAPWLPSPWQHQDIGSIYLGGSSQEDSTTGTYTLTGSGTDIWGTADAFQFAWQPLTGDGQVITRVTSISPTNSWTKAGIMLRETNDPGSRHVSLFLTPGNGVAFQYRNTTGGSSTNANYSATGPLWLKLLRHGNQITASQSTDGMNWTLVGTDTVTLNASLEVGLALSSHDNNTLATATFDNFSLMQGLPTSTTPPTVPTGLTAVTTGDASVALQWSAATDQVGVTGYNLYRNGQLINTTTLTKWIDTGLSPSQSYAYTVQAIDFGGLTSNQSAPLNITTAPSGVPTPWVHQEIGLLGVVGTASGSGTSFTLTASGADIWNTTDALGFVEQPMTGDGQITAEVNSVADSNSWAKGGVMLRNTLAPGSPFVDMLVTPGSGLAFQYRSTLNGNCTTVAGPVVTAPYYVRLVRQGNVVRGLVSPDGVTWSQIGQVTTTLASTIDAGLAVTSHNNGVTTTANFSQVNLGAVDYYQGNLPTLTISSGNNQTGAPGSTLTQPLQIVVKLSNGQLAVNAPVTFSVGASGGLLFASLGGTGQTSLSVTTNSSGVATVYYQLPSSGAGQVVASATTEGQTTQISFSEGSVVQTPTVAFLAGGSDHTLLVKSNGTLEAWGRNQFGQLGLAPGADVFVPTAVTGITNAAMVATGQGHTLILNKDGTVSSFGDNYFGQLGNGTTTDNATPTVIPNLTSIIAVAAGENHSAALKSDGTVWTWGSNSKGQLGEGDQVDRLSPNQVPNLTGVTALASGRNFIVALEANGNVVAWGSNTWGQLGNGTTTDQSSPVTVSTISNVKAISAGANHVLAVDANGHVWAWGENTFAQAGDGSLITKTTPQQVSGISGAQSVAAGWNHSLVKLASQVLLAFGANDEGQLGSGTFTDASTPIQISNPPALLLATGYDHAIALKPDQTLWLWGRNAHGQLGNGATTDTATPAQITY